MAFQLNAQKNDPIHQKLFLQFFRITWKSLNSFGALYPNGTKTGTLKAIDQHEIDGGPSNVIVSVLRKEHFDYIFPTYVSE